MIDVSSYFESDVTAVTGTLESRRHGAQLQMDVCDSHKIISFPVHVPLRLPNSAEKSSFTRLDFWRKKWSWVAADLQ
jgi:hypothetical protein